METLTINDVNGPNDRGWYDVELSDGRTATTKDKKLADVAFQARGTLVKAEVTQKPASNPKFPDNIYLNKIEVLGGAEDGATVADSGAYRSSAEKLKTDASIQIPPSKQQETQKHIAAQWAVGRALEQLTAGAIAPTQIEEKAREYLDLSRKLAAE